jgi:hypothetical protein
MYVRLLVSCARSIRVVEIKTVATHSDGLTSSSRLQLLRDRVVLVVGWLAAQALRLPCWWDVWLAERPLSVTSRVPIRDEVFPPAQALSLAHILPAEEARRAVVSAGLVRGRASVPAAELRRTLAEHLSLDQMRAIVAAWLGQLSRRRAMINKARQNETASM